MDEQLKGFYQQADCRRGIQSKGLVADKRNVRVVQRKVFGNSGNVFVDANQDGHILEGHALLA